MKGTTRKLKKMYMPKERDVTELSKGWLIIFLLFCLFGSGVSVVGLIVYIIAKAPLNKIILALVSFIIFGLISLALYKIVRKKNE